MYTSYKFGSDNHTHSHVNRTTTLEYSNWLERNYALLTYLIYFDDILLTLIYYIRDIYSQ